MKDVPTKSATRPEQDFYLYTGFSLSSTVSSGNVFYRVSGLERAKTLCRLFAKEYSPDLSDSGFFLKCIAEVEPDEQILFDEALDDLDQYDDPDRFIYDPPPSPETMTRAHYARRAQGWAARISPCSLGEAVAPDKECMGEIGSDHQKTGNEDELDKFKMPAEDRRISALNLLFMLAQTYYTILESVISTATWCRALDLELNESYLWTISNLKNLLSNHDNLRDFPATFEPTFPDLYPSTVRDVDWVDMVAPDAEQFLSTVQEYVRSKGRYSPEESSPAWVFIELFRPSINTAIERAAAYNKRMRNFANRAFGEGQSNVDTRGVQGLRSEVSMGPDVPSDFDVFLCHNSEDKDGVRLLYQELRGRGLNPWFDEEHLRPGVPWQRELETTIPQIKSVAVVVGRQGQGPWQNLELQAFLQEFVKRGCPVIPVLLKDAGVEPKLPLFLNMFTWVDFRKTQPDPWVRLVWGITGRKPKQC
jgi:hypothetical protein